MFWPGAAVAGPLHANQVSFRSAFSSAMRAAAALSCTMPLRHRGRLQSLGLDGLAVLPRAEHEVAHVVAEDGLLLLTLVERVQQRERPVALLAERTHRLPCERVERGLGTRERRRQYAMLAGDGDV